MKTRQRNGEKKRTFSLLLPRLPALDLAPRGRVGHVGVLGPGQVLRVLLHPLVLDGRLDRRRLVHLVVHPAEPLGRDLAAVVVGALGLVVDDPAVAAVEVAVVLVVLVPVLVLADELALLEVVGDVEGAEGLAEAAVLPDNLAEAADGVQAEEGHGLRLSKGA